MAEHRKQILAAFGILLLLGLAFYLRVAGLGWGLPGGYHHPDERGIIMATERIRLAPLERRAEEPLDAYLRRAVSANLEKDSPLNLKAFHYGSFPYYLIAAARGLFNDWRTPVSADGSHCCLKRLFGYSEIALAYLVLLLALFYRKRYRGDPLPRSVWVFIAAACVLWPLIVGMLHEPESLQKIFAAASHRLRFRPLLAGLCLFLPPAAIILIDSWRRERLSPETSRARLRIVFLLLAGTGLAFLFGWGLPAILERRWGYDNLGYLGRAYSVLAGVGTVALTYLLGSRCYNRVVGFLGALFLTFTVLHIQLCHYSAFDVTLAFFIMLSLYFFERIQARGTLAAYALAGVAMGAAVATKFSATTLPLLMFLPHLLFLFSLSFKRERPWRVGVAVGVSAVAVVTFFWTQAAVFGVVPQQGGHSTISYRLQDYHPALLLVVLALALALARLLLYQAKRPRTDQPSYRFAKAWIGWVLALLIGAYTVYLLQPFAFLDQETFWRSVREQSNMVQGKSMLPYTIQYQKTTPLFYPLKQLLLRGFGLPLGILILAGWLYTLVKQFRRGRRTTLLLLAWTIPSFFVYGCFQVKYPRYLVTLAPALTLLGAIFVYDLLQYARTRKSFEPFCLRSLKSETVSRGTVITLLVVLFLTAVYAFSFIRIYRRPHTWNVASNWIYKNVPKGSKILAEHWDNDLPIGLPGKNRASWAYQIDHLKVYDRPDTTGKITKMSRQLAAADYVILPTKRGYGSILRVPEIFPYTSNYYQALFSGVLGYEPVKVVTSRPSVFGLSLSDDLLDESLRVYDHPKVVVFKKQEKLTAEQIQALILKAPEWVRSISYQEVLTLQDGLPVYAAHPKYPLLRWYLLLQLIAVVFLPICYPLTQNLRDGGWSLARPMGILLIAYSGWLLSSLRAVPFGTLGLWVLLLAFSLVAMILYRRFWPEMRTLVQQRWRLLMVEELVWLGALAVFLSIRMHNPDVYWGEKPMDISFIASAYRTKWFPPLDPWLSGHVINYYYYGHAVFASLGLLCGVPAHYLFNLAVGTIPALVALGAFGLLYNLTRKIKYGLLGAYLVSLSGNLFGFFQMAKNVGGAVPEAASATPVELLTGYLRAGAEGLIAVVLLAWETLKIPLGGESVLAGGRPSELWRIIGFDSYFWKCGHDLIPHTVANEFPLWTYLFADLHAHMIVMPFTMLWIGLGFAVLSTPGRGIQLPSRRCGSWWSLFLLGVALGTIFCINPWDFPTSSLLLLAVLALKWWKFRPSRGQGGYRRFDYERSLRGFGVGSPLARRLLLRLFSFLAEVAAPLVAVVVVSIVIYLPFHMHFNPRVPLGAGSVLISLGNMTQVSTYFLIFGVFLFLVASSLLYRWHVMPGRTDGRSRELLLALLTAVVLLAGERWLSWGWALAVAFAAAVLMGLLLQRIDRQGRYWGRWTALILFTLAVLWISHLIRQRSDDLFDFLRDNALLSTLVLYRPHFKNIEFDYSTVAVLLPLWLMAFVLVIRWCRNREDAYRLLLAWIALSIGIGVEILFVKEGWEHPAHRYNTVFKFFLQTWVYLALAAAAGLYIIHNYSVSLYRPNRGRVLASVGFLLRFSWTAAVVLLLIGSAMFPIFGTYAVTLGPGARCVQGPKPDIDGLKYMDEGKGHAEYLTIHWVNRFVSGQPTLVEELGLPYQHESSRIATNTGVPTVIGWDHHIRERGPFGGRAEHDREVEQRKRDVQEIYRRQDKGQVLALLDKRQVDYLYVGSRERSKYSRDSQKFLGYGDQMDLVFHTRGGDLYRLRKNLNDAFLGEVIPLPPPGERPVESGVNMFVGGVGFDNGNFRQARGVAFDAEGRAYVADTFNHRVQVFDSKGDFVFLFGQQGEIEGEFREPNDLILDPQGRLCVVDTWNHRVQIFDSKGKFLFQIEAGFFGPRGITADAEGNLYITDTGNSRIKVFSADGKLVRQWGDRGSGSKQLFEPIGIDVNGAGEIFLADTGNRRIQVCNRQGQFLRSWSVAGEITEGRGNEQHLKVAPNGNVFLTDPAGGQIVVYTPDGRLVGTLSPKGTVRVPLQFPIGLAFHPALKQLMVCEPHLARLVRLSAPQLAPLAYE